MTNTQFLQCVALAFKKFVETHSRSNQKLKILHGQIAADLSTRLGVDYIISSLGFADGKEAKIKGRYIDKNVDITVFNAQKQAIAGVAVKFVMQNYAQNSNNYFENMLGETANIRSSKIPYFQILIVLEQLPYYNKDKTITNWETFSPHNASKYIALSKDNTETFAHTPTKTLLCVVKLPDISGSVTNKSEYDAYYNALKPLVVQNTAISYGSFGNAVIFNDYETFITKITHFIHSI